ncbi:hypothetical protein KEM48_003273 [Puccinia striiformis f. sp. tritici PST-130]|nr:hypothetical protein KEM48_003273 [Puccinia striiformis f. sp. tritici PST-130]
MDEDNNEDDDNTPPPKTSPSKGKRRALNSKNINPKSHSGPNSVASPFLVFEEYTKTEDRKSQQAEDGLGFEKMKYDRSIAKGT